MIVIVQIVNYALAFAMWMILGRAALGVLTGGRATPLQALFDRVTAPLFGATRRLLPFVGERAAPLAAFALIALARVALIVLTHPAGGR